MRKNKLLALLLSATMLVGLTACGGGSEEPAASNAGSSNAGSADAPAQATEVTIDGITYNPATDLTTENIELTL